MLDAENRGGQQRRIDRAGFADGQSADRNAAGHLRDGQQRIESLQRFRLHRHAQNRQHGFRSGHARKMRRAACAGDDDFDAALFRAGGVFEQQIRSAMRGDHARFVRIRRAPTKFWRRAPEFPSRRRAHDDADKRVDSSRVFCYCASVIFCGP